MKYLLLIMLVISCASDETRGRDYCDSYCSLISSCEDFIIYPDCPTYCDTVKSDVGKYILDCEIDCLYDVGCSGLGDCIFSCWYD